jgi:alpha-1,3-rhamnosyl/mannosyltransferase
MACGVPVVAFDNTAMVEVVGRGGVLVPDGDVGAAARAVQSLLESASRRAEMSAAALERSRDFTWERCARHHAEVYRSVGGG